MLASSRNCTRAVIVIRGVGVVVPTHEGYGGGREGEVARRWLKERLVETVVCHCSSIAWMHAVVVVNGRGRGRRQVGNMGRLRTCVHVVGRGGRSQASRRYASSCMQTCMSTCTHVVVWLLLALSCRWLVVVVIVVTQAGEVERARSQANGQAGESEATQMDQDARRVDGTNTTVDAMKTISAHPTEPKSLDVPTGNPGGGVELHRLESRPGMLKTHACMRTAV